MKRADSERKQVGEEAEFLHYLSGPELAPIFWPLSRGGVDSAWLGHVPFAHWVVGATAPRVLVELGTHNGVSYSSFCEAVQRLGLDTKCFAVDTWNGDEHAGYYGEEVYRDFHRFNKHKYGAFSELLRCTFDEALSYMADQSVDLLHIDGLHCYESVRHDFESWLPKLSDRAVVLFHDTNARERGFGVWRFWQEISQRYPSFEFLHGYGLGVLAIRESSPTEILELCRIESPDKVSAVRERFAILGERWVATQDFADLERRLVDTERRLGETEQRLDDTEQRLGDKERQLGDTVTKLKRSRRLASKLHLVGKDIFSPEIGWNGAYEEGWRKYKKKHISRRKALEIIDDRYGIGLFFVQYPLLKVLRPLGKLGRKLETRSRRKSNKLVMTLLVRDEADIIKQNIEFHLKNGVDFIIATDNGSIDGTREILAEFEKKGILYLIDEKEQNYSQYIWVNRMGEIAAQQYGADIIFHCDADEFWVPKSGNLKDEILNVKDDILVVDVINVLLEDNDGLEKFPENSSLAIVKPIPTANLEDDSKRKNIYLFQYPPKLMFKTDNGYIPVTQGNHCVLDDDRKEKEVLKTKSDEIKIYHFPIRSKEHFVTKVVNGGQSYENNKDLSPSIGFHWRRWYEHYKKGTLDSEYSKLILDKDDANKLILDGVAMHCDPNEVIGVYTRNGKNRTQRTA